MSNPFTTPGQELDQLLAVVAATPDIATHADIAAAIAAIPAVDLSGLATNSRLDIMTQATNAVVAQIQTQVNNLVIPPDLTNRVAAVEASIAALPPKPDLTPYATTTWTSSQVTTLTNLITALGVRVAALETPPVTYVRPFAASSPWNTPLTTAQQASLTANPLLQSVGMTYNYTTWCPTIIYENASLNPTTFTGKTQGGTQTISLPLRIPANSTGEFPQGPYDDIEAIIVTLPDASGERLIISLYRFLSGTFTACGIDRWTAGDGFTGGTCYGVTGLRSGVRAISCSVLGGQVMAYDYNHGSIDHALFLQAPGSVLGKTYVSPAISMDSSSNTNTGNIPYGARLAIPTTFTKPPGMSTLGSWMWDAAVKYGCILADRSNGMGFNVDPAIPSSAVNQLGPDVTKIGLAMRQVTG